MKTRIPRNVFIYLASVVILVIVIYYANNYHQYRKFAGKYELSVINRQVLIGIVKNNKKLYSETSFTLRINKSGQYALNTSSCFISDMATSTTISAGRIIKKGDYLVLKDKNHRWELKLIIQDSGLYCQNGFHVMIGKSFYKEKTMNLNLEKAENSNNSENENAIKFYLKRYLIEEIDIHAKIDEKKMISNFHSGLYRSHLECERQCLQIEDNNTFLYYFNESPVFKSPLIISKGRYSIQGNSLVLFDPILKVNYTVFIVSGGIYVGTNLPGGKPGMIFTIKK